jgi:hypothetical protein
MPDLTPDEAVPEAVPEAVTSRGCEAVTADGKPCRAAPLSVSTFCLAHSGADMRELGRRGGLVRRRHGRGGAIVPTLMVVAGRVPLNSSDGWRKTRPAHWRLCRERRFQ